MQSDPALLVPRSLPFSVSLDVLRMRISIGAPVPPVRFSPSSLAVPLIVPVVGVISHFLSVPSPFSLPLANNLRAIPLILHPRARIEQPTAGQTIPPLLQGTPPKQGCALRMPLSTNSTVGQLREHSIRWVSFPEHWWVNSGERQSGAIQISSSSFPLAMNACTAGNVA